MARAARETLQQTGPWLEGEELDQVTTSVKAALPMAKMSWLPPRYNVSHVATRDPSTGQAWVGEVPGRSLYKATLLLGPLTVQAVCSSLAEIGRASCRERV